MNRDIKLQVKGGADPAEALKLLSDWFAMNIANPEATPLTGIMSFKNSRMKIYRREYRKTDCFIAWKDVSE
jgi:hypothetical protein